MVKKTIEALPENIRYAVEEFRRRYTANRQSDNDRARMAGYVLGLRDAGFITERQRQAIFVYMTV